MECINALNPFFFFTEFNLFCGQCLKTFVLNAIELSCTFIISIVHHQPQYCRVITVVDLNFLINLREMQPSLTMTGHKSVVTMATIEYLLQWWCDLVMYMCWELRPSSGIYGTIQNVQRKWLSVNQKNVLRHNANHKLTNIAVTKSNNCTSHPLLKSLVKSGEMARNNTNYSPQVLYLSPLLYSQNLNNNASDCYPSQV